MASQARSLSTTASPRKQNRRPLEILGRVAFSIVGILLLIYTIFPFYGVIKTSITPPGQLFTEGVEYWPSNPTLENFVTVFRQRAFHLNLFASLVVAGSTVRLSLLIGSLAAHGLGYFRFRGK